MDILQDHVPQFLSFLYSINHFLQPVQEFLSFLQAQFTPILLPLITKSTSMAQDAPAIGTFVISFILLVIGLQILDFARRLVWSATRVLLKVLFWVTLVLLALAVWHRGLGRTAQDLWDWGIKVQSVWWKEYRRWEGYQTHGPKIKMGAGRAAGYGNPYGNPYGNAGTGWR